jgi:diguanylate cyclase (GGDEF)-like protein
MGKRTRKVHWISEMKQLVYQLTDLTALRDRDSLDAALVTTLHDLLRPETLDIYRLVGPVTNERWLNCAHAQEGIEFGRMRQGWTELDDLPCSGEFDARQQALQDNSVVVTDTLPPVHIFPMTSLSTRNGVLEIVCRTPITSETITLVKAVLTMYQNVQGLLDYGERDALTDLLNRKTFDGAFFKATAPSPDVAKVATDDRRNEHGSGRYWLAMLDIDHFKRVNDSFGHLIGDEVLLLLARLMRQTFRFQDQIYRFGGEEFVVLLHCKQGAEAEAAFERLRRETEKHKFPQVGCITISVGFTEVRFGDSPSGAFERADGAVYYAKEHGRNQVCGYETLVAQGAIDAEKLNVGDIELF